MIIWSGYGFLVALVTFAFSLVGELTSNSLGGQMYWNSHHWPLSLALCASGAACWLGGQVLERRPSRLLLDPATGKAVSLRSTHSLFFIPIKWWGPILGVFAVCNLLAPIFH